MQCSGFWIGAVREDIGNTMTDEYLWKENRRQVVFNIISIQKNEFLSFRQSMTECQSLKL